MKYKFLCTFITSCQLAALITISVSQNCQENDISWTEDCEYGSDCSSQIYCGDGELLRDIQMARLYPDSKTFVDKKLLRSENEILERYQKLKSETKGRPSLDQLKQFVDENFEDDPLDDWVPPDFTSNPAIANRVADENYKKWVLQINEIWKDLSKKVNVDALQYPDRHSVIYVPNGFMIAGGRFREVYYWDTYWIIRGLILCEMYQTVKGIIENFIYLVIKFGHVPNGNRIYYTQRSQPPLLIQMAATYYYCTEDYSFLQTNIQYLDAEFQYWYGDRMVSVYKNGRMYKLAKYNAPSCYPRPESFYEDYTAAQNLSKSERTKVYSNIKSAAETGWDFSTRHIITADGSNEGSLLYLNTINILYVDLNSILQANAVVLSEFYRILGNTERSSYYKHIANELLAAIHGVFWNRHVGIWQDWDLINNRHRDYFYPSNLTPLWTNSYHKQKNYIERVLDYLQTQKIIRLDGSPVYWGVPSSLINSTQQWDYPNCWAPLQAFVIQALGRSGYFKAQDIAFQLAENWIQTTYKGFEKYGFMFEKYSALYEGESGNGGEYEPQKGFGWTNGFCLELFHEYGMSLNSSYKPVIGSTNFLNDKQ